MGTEAEGPPTGGLSHLPWQQVPKFTPGVTNVDEYSQRLKFLKELWPAEHVQHLAPRAALMVEGAAFHKISRIAPDKLRSADGVQLLVETLGGSWGKTAVEEKYHYFEQAMFVVSQKADESNDSYISRHDAAFEELLARKVSIEEIRAYILLRHSQLSPEDKKKVVVEAKGDLKYQDTIKSVRLLGSKFFTDFQQRGASSKGTERTKVYDVNAAMEEGPKEELFVTEEDETDEDILMMFLDMGEEDAAYVTEFEDSIIEAVQESTLAPVFTSYLEARQRLREKARARGYFKTKGKGAKGAVQKKGKAAQGDGYRRKSLADRIAASSCRICGARGHWKRECPRREDKNEMTNYTQAETNNPYLPELTSSAPADAVYFHEEETDEDEDSQAAAAHAMGGRICGVEHVRLTASPEVKPRTAFEAAFARKLLMLQRTPKLARDAAERSLAERGDGKMPNKGRDSLSRKVDKQLPNVVLESIFVTTTGAEGVLDTGASRTVIGSDRVGNMLQGLPAESRREVRKVKSDITFRFGNSGTLSAKHALLLPAGGATWVRIEIVPGNTPLLISNRLLRDLDAVIFVRRGVLQLGNGAEISLRFDERGLSIVDLAEVLMAPQAVAHVAADAAPQADRVPCKSNIGNTTITTPTAAYQVPSSKQAQTIAGQPISRPVACEDCEPPLPRSDGHAGFAQQGSLQASGQDARDQHGRTIVGTRRQPTVSGDTAPARIPEHRVRQTCWSQHPSGLEPTQGRTGKAQKLDVRGNLPEGHPLRHGHGPKVNANFDVGAQFQGLQSSQIEENGPATASEARASDPRRLRPRGLESVPGQGGQRRKGQDGRAHVGTSRFDNESRGSSEVQLQATRHASIIDEDGGRDGPRPAADEEGAPRARASASERGRGSPRAQGDIVEGPEVFPEGRGKGHQPSEASKQGMEIQELCAKIDSSILQIEHQLKQEVRQPHEVAHKYRMPALDVLEIAQIGAGGIGQVLREHGQRVVTLQQERDMVNDFKKLWRTVSMCEPEHIWISLARPWKRRQGTQLKPFWPEDLVRELFYYQIERGRHLHVSGGPELLNPEADHLAEVQQGMLCLVHSPSQIGRKVVPSGNNHLNKQTIALTTSRAVQQALDTRLSTDPAAASIPIQPTAGQIPAEQHPRHRIHCPRFADKVAHCFKKSVGMPLPVEELLVGEHKREGSDSDLSAVQQVLKRQRLLGKQPPRQPSPEPIEDPWVKVFQMVNERVPPKGRTYVQEGDDVVAKVQELIPNMIVKHVVFCRGVNRIQPALADTRPKEVPLRYTVVVKRAGGGIVADKAPEDWSRIPKYKRGSGCVPAKIALTACGSRPLIREHGENSSKSVPAAVPAVSATPPHERPNASAPLAPQVQHAVPEEIEMQDGQAEVEPSWGPRRCSSGISS